MPRSPTPTTTSVPTINTTKTTAQSPTPSIPPQVTCLVPIYNEETRLATALTQLSQVPLISNLICVDDGSTDCGASIIKKKFPQVQLISYHPNRGKSYAIQQALPAITTPYTLLFDTDIHSFTAQDVQAAIQHTLAQADLDMLIFRQMNDPQHVKFFRIDLLHSGERLIKTSLLKEIIASHQPKHYQLENTINRYCYENQKHVAWYPFYSENYRKLDKWGYWQARWKSAQYYYGLISGQNLFTLLKIMKNFCRSPFVNENTIEPQHQNQSLL
jgi:glycosyltransferase involved in cell wall biosynthesis